MSAKLVLVAAISGAFGVRGEVRLRPFTADPDALLDYSPLLHADGAVALTITGARPVPDGLAVTAQEVGTREEAMALRNTALYASRDAFPEPDEDEFYHVDLVGLAVEDLSGAPLGRVKAVFDGAQDLLEIEGPSGKWLLPFTRALVPIVDIAGGRLVADPPEGLLTPDQA